MSITCGTNKHEFSFNDYQNFNCSDKANKGLHKREKYQCCKMLKDCRTSICKDEDFDCNMTCPTNPDDGEYKGTFVAQADGTYIEAMSGSWGLYKTMPEDSIDKFCNVVTCGPPDYVHKLGMWE